MSLSNLNKIQKKLDLLSTKSRGLVIKQLAKLRKVNNSDQKIEKVIEQLDELTDQIIEEVEIKKQKRPNIEYPSLPVSDRVDEIKKMISDNQVTIIAGETGSGKSTQLPKICLDLGLGCRGFIGHTQPRRLAARSVAQRVSDELNSNLGDAVGYKVRFQDQTSDETYIKVMTDGILLAELQTDKYLSQYDTIIIDEAHERSLNIDFILGYLKRLLPKRPDLKVIITSATIDHQRFSEYFHNAPIIEVSGRTYPVEIRYHEDWQEDDKSELSQAERILQAIDELSEDGNGDILVFLATEREIHETAEFLNKSNLKHTDILPLFARLSNQEQQKIFNPYHKRRVILSTNVAETSVTVPGIRYVIDTGKVRISRYNYKTKVQRLPIESISQASANQRAGRCGRVAEGICIRLYSEDDFLSRSQFTDPEILRTNLASVILQMQFLGLGDIEKFPFIESPDNRFISDGFRLLYELNAIDENKNLTPIGNIMAKLPIEPRFGRMLVEAKSKACLSELLIIVSFLSIQDPRERPQSFQEAAKQKHLQDQNKYSDFQSILNLWQRVHLNLAELSNNQFKKFCRNEFLSFLRIREWRDIYRQLSELVKGLKWPIKPLKILNKEALEKYKIKTDDQLHQAIVSGLLSHIGFNYDEKEYLGARGIKFHIFPGSFVYKQTPKWIVASDLVETTKLYGRTTAKINVDWLESIALHLVKRHYFEPHWREKTQDVKAFEKVTLYGLDIVQKRVISYGKINLKESREIFIREALVYGKLKTDAAFYKHNLDLLDDIDELENKARRRDIIVDDQVLYDFYDRLIPEDIYNGATFNAWLKNLTENKKKTLFFNLDDITQQNASFITEKLYPNEFQLSGLKLPLNYEFDPTHHADGITMTVPIDLIERVSIEKTDWLVPGMLEEKITALMRALPKNIRKNCVPIPQYAKSIFEKINYNPSENLRDLLVKEIIKISGVRFDQSVWQDSEIDPHLMMNYQIIDHKRKIIAEGRNLRQLQNKLKNKNTQSIKKDDKNHKKQENKIYTSWDFDALKEKEIKNHHGIKTDIFPALSDQKTGVKISNENTKEKAMITHFLGIKRLIALECQHLLKTIKNALPQKHKLSLYFTPVVQSQDIWLNDLFDASIIYASELTKEKAWNIRNESDFAQLIHKHKGLIHENAQKIALNLLEIMPLYADIYKKINKKNIALDLKDSHEDIKNQLNQMIYPGFLSKTPKKWFERLNIYLKSILERIEKLPRNINEDQRFMSQVDEVYEKLDEKAEQKNLSDHDPRLIEIEWLIQELWISFYAQQFKTIEPVSIKRLLKKISLF